MYTFSHVKLSFLWIKKMVTYWKFHIVQSNMYQEKNVLEENRVTLLVLLLRKRLK